MKQKENPKKTIRILWTGGWDSTYRIIELSRQPVAIQPIYVYGDGRVSEPFERRAMQKILTQLKNKIETKAIFLPIKFIEKSSIPLNQEITDAYNLIKKDTNLGSQHEWLARLAYTEPGMEIGTEASTPKTTRIMATIHKYGKLIKERDGDCYILDPENSSKEIMLILGNFKFPIIDKTELEMKRNIELWGYEDVMENIWFCHTPIYGKPCGLCHPCAVKIKSGMDFLLPKSALKRYGRKDKTPYNVIYKLKRRISQYFI